MSNTDTRYILYQAYGIDTIVYEAVYSILSLYRCFGGELPINYRIVIYTDKEAMLKELLPNTLMDYQAITTEKIREWRGEINFVHRVKIKVLQDFFERYNAPVLYVDTDTCFRKNPASLFDMLGMGQCCMHTKEYTVGEVKKIANRIVGKTYSLPSGNYVTIKLTTQMYNAGVLGLPSSARKLLMDVVDLTDALYRTFPKHIMEQLAFSYVLAQNGIVHTVDDTIYHYWDFKEFRTILAGFFDSHQGKSIPELLTLIDFIDPEMLSQPKIAFKKLPKWKRIWLKLIGKHWKV